jgi:ubiquitin-like-conjugating enzyme ATG3
MSSIVGSLRRAREYVYPVSTKSAFLEKGVLTPEEFVKAGDELVYRCPTWSWEAGDPQKTKSYLPADKQYLVTRNVPCQNRVSSMETNLQMDCGDGDDDDWLVSSILQKKDVKDEDQDDDGFDILDSEGEIIEKKDLVVEDVDAAEAKNDADQDDEYADMADYEDDNIIMDDDAANVASSTAGSLVKVRTYDISITYDKYYQTPRVWMTGRNEHNQQPLTGKQMMEDVISDYANRTVTMEPHPHLSGHQASIHPCQHSKVMKAIVRNLIKTTSVEVEGGDETAPPPPPPPLSQGPSVEAYLFIFLKFVSSMIPTINYDFTMDVTADTSK